MVKLLDCNITNIPDNTTGCMTFIIRDARDFYGESKECILLLNII